MSADLPYRPCVGVVLVNARHMVFAGERIGTRGAWQMPQGGVDAGESPVEAARRELAEETGVRDATVLRMMPERVTYDLPEELLGTAWKGRYRGQNQTWFAMRFDGDDSQIDISGASEPEFESWRWLTSSAILDAIVTFKRAASRRVFASFGALVL